jgi:hypothetical protein
VLPEKAAVKWAGPKSDPEEDQWVFQRDFLDLQGNGMPHFYWLYHDALKEVFQSPKGKQLMEQINIIEFSFRKVSSPYEEDDWASAYPVKRDGSRLTFVIKHSLGGGSGPRDMRRECPQPSIVKYAKLIIGAFDSKGKKKAEKVKGAAKFISNFF